MKSKFSQIVKVKKQNLDKIGMRLARSRAEVVMIEGFIAEANEQIASINLPASGQISQIKSSLQLLNLARKEKEILTQRLELTKKTVMHYERQYKNANLEYEKIKYLESEDFKAQIAKIKRVEQNMLDEFGAIRYTYLKEGGS